MSYRAEEVRQRRGTATQSTTVERRLSRTPKILLNSKDPRCEHARKEGCSTISRTIQCDVGGRSSARKMRILGHTPIGLVGYSKLRGKLPSPLRRPCLAPGDLRAIRLTNYGYPSGMRRHLHNLKLAQLLPFAHSPSFSTTHCYNAVTWCVAVVFHGAIWYPVLSEDRKQKQSATSRPMRFRLVNLLHARLCVNSSSRARWALYECVPLPPFSRHMEPWTVQDTWSPSRADACMIGYRPSR